MTPLRASLPLLATLGACSMEADPPPPPDRMAGCFAPAEVNPAGEVSHWIVDSVRLPMTSAEITQQSLNVDCDPEGRPDNNLAILLSSIYGGLETSDFNQETGAMITDGRLLHLVSLQATSPEDSTGAGFTLSHAIDLDGDPSDNFDGDEPFAIDGDRGQGTTAGFIRDGRLRAQGAQLPVGVTLPSLDEVVVLPLVGARVEAVLTGDRIEGRIAGAIPEEAVDRVLIPIIHTALLRAIERDCPEAVCESGSFGEILLEVFDEDRDGAMELDEFRNHDLVQALLESDVDLHDENGDLDPRSDGVDDGLSLGVTFTAVPARLQ